MSTISSSSLILSVLSSSSSSCTYLTNASPILLQPFYCGVKLGTLALSITCYLLLQQIGGHSVDVLTGIGSCMLTRMEFSELHQPSVLHPAETGHKETHLQRALVRLDPLAFIACLITLREVQNKLIN